MQKSKKKPYAEHGKQKIYNVKPIKTKKEMREMEQAIQLQGNFYDPSGKRGRRNLMLFYLGCHTGLRVSDLIRLRVHDVIDGGQIQIREKKTGKISHAYINQKTLKKLKHYIALMHLNKNSYLFPSRKGNSHIGSVQVYRFLVSAGKLIGNDAVGTHTMRKTFGWQYYKSGGRIEELQQIFNHASPDVTRRYLGIEDEDINKKLEKFDF